MNNTLIGSINNRNVYLIQDDKVPFYICIPNESAATIVINLTDNPDEINPSKTAPVQIPEKINNIYKEFNYEGLAVVTPIIDGTIMNGLKENIDPKYTSFLNKAIGYLINKAYSFLKQSGKEIYKQIKLYNNETYRVFNERFSSMYPDRIELLKFQEKRIETPTMETNIPQTVIAPDSDAMANTTNISLDEAYKDVNYEIDSETKQTSNSREPGFVSYVLLGVIVAVLSLIGLYLLL